MNVVKVHEEDYNGHAGSVEFDNGLVLDSTYTPDCCAFNYLDFDQFHMNREFPTMTGEEFLNAITVKEDGFYIKDSFNVPAWVQARSIQNGYYSANVDLVVEYNGELVTPEKEEYAYDRMFEGVVSDS